MLSTEIVNFGKQMDAAKDKQMLIDLAEGCTNVLDLGAGTGAISREIAKKWGCHVDAVDVQFKGKVKSGKFVTYHRCKIEDYKLKWETDPKAKKYDCVVLSAILHELTDWQISNIIDALSNMCAPNCRILIREPFYDEELGPISANGYSREDFIELIPNHIPCRKYIEYLKEIKLDTNASIEYARSMEKYNDPAYVPKYIDWVNLAFAVSYGDESWEREKREKRYARSLNWCKETFSKLRTYTGFQVFSVRDESYADLFKKAGFPKEMFDMIDYTGMIVVIDYSKKED